jgi:hypothetical protein
MNAELKESAVFCPISILITAIIEPDQISGKYIM